MSLPPLALPLGIRSRQVQVNDLSVHILEAGFETTPTSETKPLILLLHGFPEIAYSWRKLLLPLSHALNAHVVASDQRGYGRTTVFGSDTYNDFDTPHLADFTFTRAVRDAVGLVNALGYRQVHTLVGHDMGSTMAAWCALVRGDVFRRLVMIASPFPGPPGMAFGSGVVDGTVLGSEGGRVGENENEKKEEEKKEDVHEQLRKMGRKHYKWYYSTRPANADMVHDSSQSSLETFFRGYFHQKSADWPHNHPHPLTSWSAVELAKMPNYYVMNLTDTMRTVTDADMPSEETVNTKSSRWIPQGELAVYAQEYARTGFQGGLNYYRTMTDSERLSPDWKLFSGMKITVPAVYMVGDKDWARYQLPNVVENHGNVFTDYRGEIIIEGAGHWAQQEQPEKVLDALVKFVKSTS